MERRRMTTTMTKATTTEFDSRTRGLVNNLKDFGPIDTIKAKHRIYYGTAKDEVHEVEYGYSFEIIAVPTREDLLIENSRGYASKVIGAINYTPSPKGNRFDGKYSWKKNKKAWYHSEANDIEGILEEYGFSFVREEHYQSSKLPCIIYANLVSTKLNYIGQSKAEVDTAPFARTIIKACKAIARDIPTFRVADIRTPDYHAGSSGSYISYRRAPKLVKERKERKYISDVIYEKLQQQNRITEAQAGRNWGGEFHTQMSLWYNCLSLINKYVELGKLKKPKNRDNFIDKIREVCDENRVTRESVGIVAAAYSTMYYNGKWLPVNFADIGKLALNGVAIVFIEKEDIVQALGQYASIVGVALVNSKGQLSQYAKDLSRAARVGRANIGIFTDYDIPGLHIASKLPDALWLGVDEPMLKRFRIFHSDEDYVIPFDPEKGIGDDVIDRDIRSDPRFQYPRVDIEWLKRHKNPQTKAWDPGHKVEIDAVLAKAGAKALWDYLMEQMKKSNLKSDYNRVITTHTYAPVPKTTGFAVPQLVGQIQVYMRDRASSLTKSKREEYHNQFKEYPGFMIVIDKENEIRKELSDIVHKDQQLTDITTVLSKAAESVESSIIEAVTSGIKKLDQEKGYNIMGSLKGVKVVEQEDDEDKEEQQ